MPLKFSDLPRAYGRFGKVVHLLPFGASLNNRTDSALCGYYPSYWMGSGSWAEQDRAATLPLCARCLHFADTDLGIKVPQDVTDEQASA